MFELDTTSGTIICERYKLNKDLKHDAFTRQYPEVMVTDERGPNIKVYGVSFHLIESQMGSLSVCFWNQDIQYIHIDVDETYLLELEKAGEDVDARRWELQWQWILVLRALIYSHLGKPDLIKPSFVYDKASFLLPEILVPLEDWTYQYSWGKLGLSCVDEDWSYRLWLSYKPEPAPL